MNTSQKILLAVTVLFVSSFATEGEAAGYRGNGGQVIFDPSRMGMSKPTPQQHQEAQERARLTSSEIDRNRMRGNAALAQMDNDLAYKAELMRRVGAYPSMGYPK